MNKIMNIDELLKLKLTIPDYQRPYKWRIQNIQNLLNDISNSISDSKKHDDKFKYRIGTIILHKENNENENDNVVDGQQRIISLVLLKLYLEPDFQCSILDTEFNNKTSQHNIYNNYSFIREWFSLKEGTKDDFRYAMESILEVVVIYVDKIEEAFQLFDSQNMRGKALDPHDLLKAYHLREMKNDSGKMKEAVIKWEEKNTAEIRNLFDLYLFPIWNWSHGKKTRAFTVNEIGTYKGISESSDYFYAYRTSKAMPYFQITEPFIAGGDFFKMVEHYLLLLSDIKAEINTNSSFEIIKQILEEKNDSAGFKYAKNLFYCALLHYYDKFHNFDEMSIKKLFVWAFMIRVDMDILSFRSINNYAIGNEKNSKYTNSIAMFSMINLARLHSDISSLQIKTQRQNNNVENKKWNDLYSALKQIMGIKETGHE